VIGVIFTLAGTLGSDNGLYRVAIQLLVSDLYRERSERPDGRVIDAIVRNLHPSASPDGGAVELLEALFPQSPREPGLATRFSAIARDLVEEHFQPYEDARALLARLKELHVPLGVLGEGWSAVEHRKARMLELDGAPVVAGGRSPAAFAAMAEALHLPSDAIWFVGREPRDIAAAHAAGFRTVWLNRTGSAYPAGLVRPEHTIGRLEAVLGIISRPYMHAAMLMSGLVDSFERRRSSP
jgi:FMN phosphatase YigB (HAD superfamily)